MSEAVSYNIRPTFQQACKVIIGGNPYDTTATANTLAQRQFRPKSSKTQRVGEGYVYPTDWIHNGCTIVQPVTSGAFTPFGAYRYVWEYFAGIPNVTADSQILLPPINGDEMNKLKEAADVKCLLKLKDQKVNLGVSLAEAKEAAEMVGNAARRIGNIFEGAYNRRPKDWLAGVRNAGRNWKKVPAYYLEYVYGVAPIMSDVDGICQQLAETYNRGNSPIITAFGESKDTMELDVSLSGGMQQFGELRGTGTLELIARVGCTATAPSWVMQDYNSLGVTNPFSIAWERVGYSHVVDWFYPVGNWINTWDVSNYLHFLSGFTTRFMRYSGTAYPIPGQGGHDWQVRVSLPGYVKAWQMVRTASVTFPPTHMPQLRNPLSLDHMAQGLAMLSQVIGGHKRLASRGPR